MVILQETTLEQPKPYFGAVMGKTRYGKWIMYTTFYVILVGLTIFSTKEEFFFLEQPYSYFGIALTLSVISGIVWFFYTNYVFNRKNYEFYNDARLGMRRYARSEVRDWVNSTYGLDVSDEDAEQMLLSNWGYARVLYERPDGRNEYVQVRLDGLEKLSNSIGYDGYDVGETPDVSRMEPRLMIIEDPKKPRVYEFPTK
jgi:hypothetical protein